MTSLSILDSKLCHLKESLALCFTDCAQPFPTVDPAFWAARTPTCHFPKEASRVCEAKKAPR